MNESTAIATLDRELPVIEVLRQPGMMVQLATLIPTWTSAKPDLLDDAQAIVAVKDETERDVATLRNQELAEEVKQITAYYKPYKSAAHQLHAAINTLEENALMPRQSNINRLKSAVLAFNQAEQRRKQAIIDEENRKAREAAEAERRERDRLAKIEQDKRDAEARAAQEEARKAQEAARKTKDAEARARLEREAQEARERQRLADEERERLRLQHEADEAARPQHVDVVLERGPASNVGAAATATTYSAKLLDLPVLLAAAVRNPEAFLNCVTWNESAVQKRAIADKEMFSVPGCKLVKTESMRTLRKR